MSRMSPSRRLHACVCAARFTSICSSSSNVNTSALKPAHYYSFHQHVQQQQVTQPLAPLQPICSSAFRRQGSSSNPRNTWILKRLNALHVFEGKQSAARFGKRTTKLQESSSSQPPCSPSANQPQQVAASILSRRLK